VHWGFTAPETKAAAEQAHLLVERAEALGERSEDPLPLFSVLHSFWVANTVALKGDVARDLAAQFLALAEKQGATVPLMIGHRLNVVLQALAHEVNMISQTVQHVRIGDGTLRWFACLSRLSRRATISRVSRAFAISSSRSLNSPYIRKILDRFTQS
jgi:hypothetical protein